MSSLFQNPASFGFPISPGAVIPTTSTVRDLPLYDIPVPSEASISAAEAGLGTQSKGASSVLPGISAALPGSLSLMDSPPSFIAKSQADGFADFGNVSSTFGSGEFVIGGKSSNNGLVIAIVAAFAALGFIVYMKAAK